MHTPANLISLRVEALVHLWDCNADAVIIFFYLFYYYYFVSVPIQLLGSVNRQRTPNSFAFHSQRLLQTLRKKIVDKILDKTLDKMGIHCTRATFL